MTGSTTFTLTIADSDWMDAGEGENNHLTMDLVINGKFHHFDAIRIVEDAGGRQHAASPDIQDIFDAMFMIGGGDPFTTLTIGGGTYVALVVPLR
jgi:hypothetical protein